jgi:hypothetical protein
VPSIKHKTRTASLFLPAGFYRGRRCALPRSALAGLGANTSAYASASDRAQGQEEGGGPGPGASSSTQHVVVARST